MAQKIAKFYPREAFVGVTGSVGKTTTTKAAFAVLSQKFKTISTHQSKLSNLDPIFNIPMTILRLRPSVKKAIFEMGVEFPGDMDINLSLVQPASAIFTRTYFAHSQFLGDNQQIFEEKVKVIKQLPQDGYAILNWDDVWVRKAAEQTKAQVIFYGMDPKNCHVWADKVSIDQKMSTFQLNYGVERVEVKYALLGRHQLYSALAASALGISCGLSLTNVKKGLETVEPESHRLQLLDGIGDTLVLDDTYNSSPSAVEGAIDLLMELPARRRVIVLGEMRELGKFSEELHRKVAQKIYKEKVDLVFLGGGDAVFIGDELKKLGFPEERIEQGLSNPQIVAKLLRVGGKGDVILVKASRSVRLDEVVQRITKRR
ncbi:UDP-N-acetylmuramoyl-tripeptide--D-alanyl-D-alanine ligase [Candidatus Daviesbacteria bacterium]|nr:UDP-N-acetylmuramoyl-tripeptide--D-alanyl-D-alanine ligase [Candidatus Daviesbacteria bacterium]